MIRWSLAALGAVVLAMALFGGASAQTQETTYRANLVPLPLNGATGATGTLTLVLNGNQATITQQVSGLAGIFNNAPYPHVQHIHGGAQGVCPAASADTNADGVLSTTEGGPAYGAVQTTLSVSGDTSAAAATNLQIAPTGAAFSYNRTITLDAATATSVRDGKAVIVVHGLDPAKAAPAATSAPSDLVPSLPLAATSPALCGTLVAQQQSATPTPTATGTGTPTAGSGSSGSDAAPVPPRTGNAGLASATGEGAPTLLASALLAVALGTAVMWRTRIARQR